MRDAVKSWKFLVTFSILLPVVAIFAVKSPGLINDPTKSASIVTMQQTRWEFEKPSFSLDRPLWLLSSDEVLVQNSFQDDKINVTFIISPLGFILSDPFYDGSSDVVFDANVTASVNVGYLENVRLTFSESYSQSHVRLAGLFYGPQASMHATFNNLIVTDEACYGSRESLLAGDVKAYVNAVAANSSSEVLIDTGPTGWILRAPANMSQELQASAEVTYFNGTNHVSVVLPTVLSLIPDVGNTLENARTITAGSYLGTVSRNWDPIDCYKIWLKAGQKVTISTAVIGMGTNVSLADALGRQVASVQSESFELEVLNNIEYASQSDGYWYVQISNIVDQGLYRLIVVVK